MSNIKIVSKIITVCALSVVVVSCGSFEYHPYGGNHVSGKISIHTCHIPEIEKICAGRDSFKFAFITDTQGSYDDMEDAVGVISRRGDIDFIVHGGDQTDFGLPKEFMWCRDIMERCGLPYVSVIGNHDCLGNGKYTFEYIYGRPDFSFNAGYVHFICLNTVALEYPNSSTIPDFDFISQDLGEVVLLNELHDSITVTVAVMHSRPGDEQFNNSKKKDFIDMLKRFPGGDVVSDDGVCDRMFCVNGHNHRSEILNIDERGLLFYGCPNIGRRVFYVFTVTERGYECETVEF